MPRQKCSGKIHPHFLEDFRWRQIINFLGGQKEVGLRHIDLARHFRHCPGMRKVVAHLMKELVDPVIISVGRLLQFGFRLQISQQGV